MKVYRIPSIYISAEAVAVLTTSRRLIISSGARVNPLPVIGNFSPLGFSIFMLSSKSFGLAIYCTFQLVGFTYIQLRAAGFTSAIGCMISA